MKPTMIEKVNEKIIKEVFKEIRNESRTENPQFYIIERRDFRRLRIKFIQLTQRK